MPHGTCQHVVSGDLSGRAWVNPSLHPGVPNLFGLPAPVQSKTAQARTNFVAPVATTHSRSAPIARVDRDSTDTAIETSVWLITKLDLGRRSRLTRLRIQCPEPELHVAPAMAAWFNWEWIASMTPLLWENLPVPGCATRIAPKGCLPSSMRDSSLVMAAILTRVSHVMVRNQFVMTRSPMMTTIISSPRSSSQRIVPAQPCLCRCSKGRECTVVSSILA